MLGGLANEADGCDHRRVAQVGEVELRAMGEQLADVEGLHVLHVARNDIAKPHLHRASQSGAIGEDALHVARIAHGQGQRLRPRPDQRHLTAKHVQQLGQLVETGQPHQGAEPCHAAIAGPGDLGTALPRAHAADLVHREGHASLAHAHLPVDRRSIRADPCRGKQYD